MQVDPQKFVWRLRLRKNPVTSKQKNLSRELAFLRLKALGADITKPCVVEVVDMIWPESYPRPIEL